jgi:hypothetical protein
VIRVFVIVLPGGYGPTKLQEPTELNRTGAPPISLGLKSSWMVPVAVNGPPKPPNLNASSVALPVVSLWVESARIESEWGVEARRTQAAGWARTVGRTTRPIGRRPIAPVSRPARSPPPHRPGTSGPRG